MTEYLTRRAARTAALLLMLSLGSFLMARLAGGSFLDELALNPSLTPATLAALRTRYGFDRPVGAQYAAWVRSVAAGDLGRSAVYQQPVLGLLWPRALRTLELTSLALVLTWLLALPLGMACAARRGGGLDRGCSLAASTLLAIPEVLVALGVLYWAARSRVMPVAGSLAAPLVVLVVAAWPVVFRHVRSALLDVAQAGYIRNARAHGIGGVRLWWRYLLPAAANPLISLAGVAVGSLASSSLVVEAIFGWPGLGPLFLEAISARDLDLVVGTVLLSAIIWAAANLAADLLHYAADPRLRRPTA